MKKILVLALAVMMIASLAVVNASAANQSWTAATGTPTLDGKMDDCYLASSKIDIKYELSTGAESGFATGEAYTCWDANYLYIYAFVTDPVLSPVQNETVSAVYQTDSLEVYIDLNHDESLTIADEENCGQYTAGYLYIDDSFTVQGALDETTGAGWAGTGLHTANNMDKAKAVYDVSNTAGYACEYAIPWGPAFKPTTNAVIGFMIEINDDADGDSVRDYQVFADSNEVLVNAWQYTEGYCDLVLSDAVYVAPVEEAPADAEAPADGAAAAAVDAPAAAPKTADAGIVVAAAVMAIAAGVVLSKKH